MQITLSNNINSTNNINQNSCTKKYENFGHLNKPGFKANGDMSKLHEDDPIDFKYELINSMLKSVATIAGGIGLMCAYNMDYVFDIFAKIKKSSKNCMQAVGILGFVFASITGIMCLIKFPETYYNTRVKTVKKHNDVNVYLRNNKLEKDIFEKIDNKVDKVKNEQEKEQLVSSYMKISAMKQDIPNLNY